MGLKENLIINIFDNENKIESIYESPKLKIHGNYQLELIKHSNTIFLECIEVKYKNNEITIVTKKEDKMRNLTQLGGITQVEKLLMLIQIGKTITNKSRYITWLSPDNIWFNNKYEIKFAARILGVMVENNEVIDNLEEYKSLILSILQNKYTYNELISIGIDILDKDSLFLSIIESQTITEVLDILNEQYDKKYLYSKTEVMAFPVKFVKTYIIAILTVILILVSSFVFFAYQYFSKTNIYLLKKDIYESYYANNHPQVKEIFNSIKTEDYDIILNKIVADSFIKLGVKKDGDMEDIKKAFYLDESRQIECLEILLEKDELDIISSLDSDKNKVQLYKEFASANYEEAIRIAETNLNLKYDAQANIILARSYMEIGEYIRAEQLIDGMGDKALQLEIYKKHREDVIRKETNIETRKNLITQIDKIIEILEEQVSEKNNNEN